MYTQSNYKSTNISHEIIKNSNTNFLRFVFIRGGTAFPAKESGAPVGKLSNKIYQLESVSDMRQWAVDKIIRRFIFRPESAGLIGIDLDEKRGKHGVRELEKIIGDIDRLPYVSTPSGGKHLYFLNDGTFIINRDVEVFHDIFLLFYFSINIK